MEFGILGPLEVREHGNVVELGAPKARALAAILLLHANEVVSTDRLVDDLWGEEPPASAKHVLQVYVSQLRKALEQGGDGAGRHVVTRAPGYMIELEPEKLDLSCFERLVEEAQTETDPAAAAATLREALTLWRGPPLADFAYEPFAQPEVARLEELRMHAIEERIESDLALARHDALVGELERLVAEHPLRERLRGQLMLALYRSGRQAEALSAYQDARRTLVEELGIEPGPALQGLEKRILRQDPELGAPRAPPPPPAPAPGAPLPARSARRRLGVLVAGAVLLAAGVAAALAVLLGGGDGGGSLDRLPPNSVGRIDPESNLIVGATMVGSGPTLIAAGEGGIWVANFDDRTLSRIDPATGGELRRISTEGAPTGLAAGAGAVWVAHGFEGTLSRVDPGLDRITATIRLGNGAHSVAVGEGAVWVANSLDGTVIRIDPDTNVVDATIEVGGNPADITVGAGAVWLADGRAVVRLDPASGAVKRIALRYNATEVTVGAGAVWVSNRLGDSVTKIGLATATATSAIPVGDDPVGIVAGEGAVWVANSTGRSLSRIDPSTSAVVATIGVGNALEGVALDRELVWVTAPGP